MTKKEDNDVLDDKDILDNQRGFNATMGKLIEDALNKIENNK